MPTGLVMEELNTTEAPQLDETPMLVYNWLCPFVHRVTIAKEALGLDSVRLVPISLGNKPAWFTELSPNGKVPMVAVKDQDGSTKILYESMVLIDYMEDLAAVAGPHASNGSSDDGPAAKKSKAGEGARTLLHGGPAERARARIIAARFGESAIPLFYQVMKSDSAEKAQEAAAKLHKELDWLEQHMDPQGPFLAGPTLGYADCAVLPWLLRSCVLEHYRGLDMFKGHARLQAYVDQAWGAAPVVGSCRLPSFKVASGEEDMAMWRKAMIDGYVSYGGERRDWLSAGAQQ